MNWRKIAVLGLVVLAAGAGRAATYYVSPSGNDANSGTNWALAKLTINAGVGAATSGDTVWVTNGTYLLTATISLSQGINLKSVNGAQLTAIDGGGAVRCVSVATNAVLDGFTITNGYDFNSGGGVYNAGGTVQNCTISGNTDIWYGGGVYNDGGMVQNCTISGNRGNFVSGGGVYNDGGTVKNCMIGGNTATSGGGVYNSAGTVQNCTISLDFHGTAND